MKTPLGQDILEEEGVAAQTAPVLTTELPAAAVAAATSQNVRDNFQRYGDVMESMGMDLYETMRKMAGEAGHELPPRPVLPCEVGCIESDFEGLPARQLFQCVTKRGARAADLEQLLSAEAHLAGMVDA